MAHPNDVQSPEETNEVQRKGVVIENNTFEKYPKPVAQPQSGDNGPQPPKPPKPISG